MLSFLYSRPNCPPTPSPASEYRVGVTLAWGERGWGTQFRQRDRHSCTLCTVYYNPSTRSWIGSPTMSFLNSATISGSSNMELNQVLVIVLQYVTADPKNHLYCLFRSPTINPARLPEFMFCFNTYVPTSGGLLSPGLGLTESRSLTLRRIGSGAAQVQSQQHL